MSLGLNRWLVFAIIVGVLLTAILAACGTDDPYTGTWINEGNGTFKIQKANEGWWSIDISPEGVHTYGAEIDGELQTMNGAITFKRSGEKLEFDIASDNKDPVLLVSK